jgi:hypothetical protein
VISENGKMKMTDRKEKRKRLVAANKHGTFVHQPLNQKHQWLSKGPQKDDDATTQLRPGQTLQKEKWNALQESLKGCKCCTCSCISEKFQNADNVREKSDDRN